MGPDGAGNINLNGDGVFTQVEDNAAGNQLIVTFLDAIQGTTTTIGLQTRTIASVQLGAVPGTYEIEARVAAFNASTPAAFGSKIIATARTTGAAGVLIGVNNDNVFNEVALEDAVAQIEVNISTANSFDIVATGVAGLTIEWKATVYYTFVS